MAERNAAAGYIAVGKQTNAITPVSPTIYIPYYDQNIETNINLIADKPVYGAKFGIFQQLQGMRDHKGTTTMLWELNTCGYLIDAMLTNLGVTGSGPYTHTWGLSTTQDPNFYTWDISLVSQSIRFFGVGISKITPKVVNEEWQADCAISALGSFYGREIASIAGQVITLKTVYDPAPTTGLVVGDNMSVKAVDGSVALTGLAIGALTATTVTVTGTITGVAAGQMLVLAPNTPTLALSNTAFLWPTTDFVFGASVSAALSNSQVRLDPGTTFDVSHSFQNDAGEKRSGGFDPASLVRTTGMYTFKVKQYFDLPDQIKQWEGIYKQACLVRMFAGATGELRFVMNNIRQSKETIQTKFGDTIYQEEEFAPMYDQSDGSGMSWILINSVATY